MKMRKLLTMLLAMLLMFAMVGTLAGCGAKDGGNDKQVEADGDDTGKKDTEEKPEATATPEPTPTPEVLPTAEELFAANEEMFDGNMKMTMKFAYKGETEYGEMAMSVDAVQCYYDNITYQKNNATVSMLGINQTMDSETYYVDDEESALRTEYYWDSETGVWTKSQYAYIDMTEEEEDEEASPLEDMKNVEITQDEDFYYMSGELEGEEVFDDTESLGMDGLEMGSTSCVLKFDKETKKAVSAEVVIKFVAPETEEGTFTVDDFVVAVEALTEPIVIPEEALAAELETDVDIDWEIDDDDEELNLPEPEKYAEDEIPAAWGGWYDEYNCKSGTFMMWDNDTYETIPITVFAKENWFFDNQYTWTLYLAVNAPEIRTDSPAYEVDYSDSDIAVVDVELAPEKLVDKDYNEVTTVEDVVPIVCNGRQCFYLDNTDYEYIRTFIVLQDIGLDNYVEISISTADLTTEPLDIVQMFLLNITSGESEGSGEEV